MVVGVSVVASGVVSTALVVGFCHGRFGTGTEEQKKILLYKEENISAY